MNTENRHIVFITDDNYCLPTKVVITSLASNIASDNCNNYFVHICTFGISEENARLLKSCETDSVSVDIKVINEDEYSEKFAMVHQKSHVTPAALIKFDLGNLFPDIDKVLYLDSDIIINKSLEELFRYDVSEKYAAASFEFWEYMLEVFKYKSKTVPKLPFYFNSGVILFNLKKIREDNISEKLWKTKYARFNNPNAQKQCMDQDSLNAVLSENCVHLPIKFNCNCAFTEGYDIQNINFVYGTKYKSGEEMKNDAVIIHYVGKTDKPWKYSDAKCRELWDFYYQKASFDLNQLQRITLKKDLKYFLTRLKISFRERGFFSTVKYVFHK